jgi:hypothetical protein
MTHGGSGRFSAVDGRDQATLDVGAEGYQPLGSARVRVTATALTVYGTLGIGAATAVVTLACGRSARIWARRGQTAA